MTSTDKAEEFDYNNLVFDEPSEGDQGIQNPDQPVTDTSGQTLITDLVEPAKSDTQDEPKTDTDVNTDTEYFVDENGNLSFEKDGKTFVAKKKGEFSFNEETNAVELEDDIDPDLVVLNHELNASLSDVLSLLPEEERSISFDGSLTSLQDLVSKAGKGYHLKSMSEILSQDPTSYDLLEHLGAGGSVKSFMEAQANARIDLTALPDTPSPDQMKQVIITYLKDVAKLNESDDFYETLKTNQKVNEFYATAKASLENHYKEADMFKASKEALAQAAREQELKNYWQGIQSKIATKDLAGLKISKDSDVEGFYKYISQADPKTKTTQEQQFLNTLKEEERLAIKHLTYSLFTGAIKISDLNRLYNPATKDVEKRIIKAVITKNSVKPPTNRAPGVNTNISNKDDFDFGSPIQ
jgi:hypothetical protein